MVRLLVAALFATLSFLPAQAAQLVMVEEAGCMFCARWNREIGPIYPKTPEGSYAPLLRTDISAPEPEGVSFVKRVVYTPTFILIDNGAELARIEGYPGEDFFWGLLEMMLIQHTTYSKLPNS